MPVLFMAGVCRRYEDGDHFVILTTAADESVLNHYLPVEIGTYVCYHDIAGGEHTFEKYYISYRC